MPAALMQCAGKMMSPRVRRRVDKTSPHYDVIQLRRAARDIGIPRLCKLRSARPRSRISLLGGMGGLTWVQGWMGANGRFNGIHRGISPLLLTKCQVVPAPSQ